jgi:integrase
MNNTASIKSEMNSRRDNIIAFPNINSNKKNHKNKINHYNGTVQPIKDKEDIERAKEYFLNSNNFRYTGLNIRNYCLFVLGLNTGRRIGDILSLRFIDILDRSNNTINEKITIIKEQKTKKKATFYLADEVKDAINKYIDFLKSNNEFNINNYIFKTRESECMTRNQAWKIWHDMGETLGLERIGTHSGRKTKGYQYMQDHKGDYYALARVSKAYGHSKQEITLDYLGLDNTEMRDFYLGHVL